MIVTLGEANDEERDPTVLWSTDRKKVHAGVLNIHAITPSEKAESFKINVDPLMMADGIEPSGDPVLLFRSPSYALSHSRRLQEVVS